MCGARDITTSLSNEWQRLRWVAVIKHLAPPTGMLCNDIALVQLLLRWFLRHIQWIQTYTSLAYRLTICSLRVFIVERVVQSFHMVHDLRICFFVVLKHQCTLIINMQSFNTVRLLEVRCKFQIMRLIRSSYSTHSNIWIAETQLETVRFENNTDKVRWWFKSGREHKPFPSAICKSIYLSDMNFLKQ